MGERVPHFSHGPVLDSSKSDIRVGETFGGGSSTQCL